MLIRLMEEYCTIKRLVAHEFGHAIAYSYHLEEDVIIKSLYIAKAEGVAHQVVDRHILVAKKKIEKIFGDFFRK